MRYLWVALAGLTMLFVCSFVVGLTSTFDSRSAFDAYPAWLVALVTAGTVISILGAIGGAVMVIAGTIMFFEDEF
jgi:uncharacterized membrane protein